MYILYTQNILTLNLNELLPKYSYETNQVKKKFLHNIKGFRCHCIHIYLVPFFFSSVKIGFFTAFHRSIYPFISSTSWFKDLAISRSLTGSSPSWGWDNRLPAHAFWFSLNDSPFCTFHDLLVNFRHLLIDCPFLASLCNIFFSCNIPFSFSRVLQTRHIFLTIIFLFCFCFVILLFFSYCCFINDEVNTV